MNFMTAPAALKEHEKIKLFRDADNDYNHDYAVTATQKAIQKAFGITSEKVHKQTRRSASILQRLGLKHSVKIPKMT